VHERIINYSVRADAGSTKYVRSPMLVWHSRGRRCITLDSGFWNLLNAV
jgi:hypothetical protein